MSTKTTNIVELCHQSKLSHQSGQPKTLTWLFLTEMWERFSYWSLYSLLVIYMVHVLNFTDGKSYLVFASFNAILYTSPIIGGWLADRYLNAHTAVLHGCIWLILGYLGLALSHGAGAMYYSLSLLIWGNGLFKPNISTVLGCCYKEDDPRRERGFTIYYMGINIGAIIGTIGCGWLALHVSWEAAYFTVAAGMLLGIITYVVKSEAIKNDVKIEESLQLNVKTHLGILALGLILIWPLTSVLASKHISSLCLNSTIVVLACYLIHITIKLPAQGRARMISCIILIISSIAFWALYMQMGSSLTLYTQRCVNLTILKHRIAASSVGSVNGIWLLMLSPVIVKLWKYLSSQNKEPKTHAKFLLGIILMASGYFVLAVSAWQLMPGVKANIIWVLASYGLQTLGELCLSPIGLAMITELAPTQHKSLMMGVWFLATAIASLASGQLAKLAAIPIDIGQHVNIGHIYAHAFMIDVLIALAVALILLALIPTLRKLLIINN